MTEEQPTPRTTTIPLIRDNELRLAKMRRQLEDMFRSLDLVHDEVIVSSEAARSQGLPEVANVLGLCVSNRLFGQLRSLTNIIERLGGRTYLSDGEESLKEAPKGGGSES